MLFTASSAGTLSHNTTSWAVKLSQAVIVDAWAEANCDFQSNNWLSIYAKWEARHQDFFNGGPGSVRVVLASSATSVEPIDNSFYVAGGFRGLDKDQLGEVTVWRDFIISEESYNGPTFRPGRCFIRAYDLMASTTYYLNVCLKASGASADDCELQNFIAKGHC